MIEQRQIDNCVGAGPPQLRADRYVGALTSAHLPHLTMRQP